MSHQTLFQYLTRTQVPLMRVHPKAVGTENTKSDAYPIDSVVVHHLPSLTYGHIMQKFGATLYGTPFTGQNMPYSPPGWVRAEESVKEATSNNIITPLRRVLRDTIFPAGHTRIIPGMGDMAPIPKTNARPDVCGFTSMVDPMLRLPGDIKCSWKWNPALENSTLRDQKEFLAVCAQLNFYMNQASSRYGYIISNTEVVFFKKFDDTSCRHLWMFPAIPLSVHDSTHEYTQTRGEVTALLALWYFHFLASVDEMWLCENNSASEEDNDQSGTYSIR